MLVPLTLWIITNCGKLLKRWEYQTILPVSWETSIQVKKQKLEPYIEQLTDLKLREEYDKAVYYHPEAWRAAIHGVAESRTRLSDWTELMTGTDYQNEKWPFNIFLVSLKTKGSLSVQLCGILSETNSKIYLWTVIVNCCSKRNTIILNKSTKKYEVLWKPIP